PPLRAICEHAMRASRHRHDRGIHVPARRSPTMRIQVLARALATATGAAAVGALTLASTVGAGQPVTQTLNPPPPSFLVCQAVGSGTFCAGSPPLQRGPIDVADEGGPAFACGSGSTAFHILDTAMVDQHVVRYYDRFGTLTRRVIHELWRSAQLSNSLTGAAL